jgi:hypothetical protein
VPNVAFPCLPYPTYDEFLHLSLYKLFLRELLLLLDDALAWRESEKYINEKMLLPQKVVIQ